MSTTTLATNVGPVSVEPIYRRGVWIVTPWLRKGRTSETEFTVTHEPSGRRITREPATSDAAIVLCRRLAEVDDAFADGAALFDSPGSDLSSERTRALADVRDAWAMECGETVNEMAERGEALGDER